VAEIRAAQRVASTLLDAYVGHHAGERILSGRIRRGDTQTIRAAIWLSDMRGFTALADRLPPAQLTELLNRYFDCQIPAILERGGEVLKFIGDGLLAIFPIGDDAGIAASCAPPGRRVGSRIFRFPARSLGSCAYFWADVLPPPHWCCSLALPWRRGISATSLYTTQPCTSDHRWRCWRWVLPCSCPCTPPS